MTKIFMAGKGFYIDSSQIRDIGIFTRAYSYNIDNIKYREDNKIISFYDSDTDTTDSDDDIYEWGLLRLLAEDIGHAYHEYRNSLFYCFNDDYVSEIQERIIDGNYRLSPFQIRLPRCIHQGGPTGFSVDVTPSEDDLLVLIGLGRMLDSFFLRAGIFSESVYDPMGSQYSNILDDALLCERGKVLRLYRIDFINSLEIMNRKKLMMKLSHLVKNKYVLDMICDFLYMPLVDIYGKVITNAFVRNNIPSVECLTSVLLNFSLIEFDHEFQRDFPGVDYIRYSREAFVFLTGSRGAKLFHNFDQELQRRLFDRLCFAGEILSLIPGGQPGYCFSGLVSVGRDSRIILKKRS